MHIHSKIRYICLTIIFTIFSVTSAEAQLWGKLKNVVKKKAEEVVTEKVSGKPEQTAKATKNQEVQGQENNLTDTQKTSSLDIVGLKLGMTPDQVISALKARNKDFKIETRLHSQNKKPIWLRNHEYVERITASLPKRKEGIHITFSEPPAKNLSQTIMRRISFKKENRPLAKNVSTALIKKYGTPSDEKRGSMFWSFGQNNTLKPSFKKNMDCDFGIQSMGRMDAHHIVSRFPSSCGYFIWAQVDGGMTAGVPNEMTPGVTMLLMNGPLYSRNFATTQKYIVDQKKVEAKKRKEEANKVKVDTDF